MGWTITFLRLAILIQIHYLLESMHYFPSPSKYHMMYTRLTSLERMSDGIPVLHQIASHVVLLLPRPDRISQRQTSFRSRERLQRRYRYMTLPPASMAPSFTASQSSVTASSELVKELGLNVTRARGGSSLSTPQVSAGERTSSGRFLARAPATMGRGNDYHGRLLNMAVTSSTPSSIQTL
jgi:hypothetical protein